MPKYYALIAENPWDLMQMACVDMRNYAPFNDGFSWILNIMNPYCKFLFSFPLYQKSADSVLAAFKRVISFTRCPKTLQTDNGKEFANVKMASYLNEMNIRFVRGRPRHHQNQGQIERANQMLVNKIAKALNDVSVKRWIDIHDSILLKYNNIWHRAINTSPMRVFYNRSGLNNIFTINDDDVNNDMNVEENSCSSPIILKTIFLHNDAEVDD